MVWRICWLLAPFINSEKVFVYFGFVVVLYFCLSVRSIVPRCLYHTAAGAEAPLFVVAAAAVSATNAAGNGLRLIL